MDVVFHERKIANRSKLLFPAEDTLPNLLLLHRKSFSVDFS